MKHAHNFFITISLFVLAACSTVGVSVVTPISPVSMNTVSISDEATDPSTVESPITAAAVTHDNPTDYVWDVSSEVDIILNNDSVSVSGEGVSVNGSRVVITSPGNYRISGNLADGQISVKTDEKETVRLILDNADITNASGSPIYIEKAEKTIVVLADNSHNSLTDSTSYKFTSAEEDEPNATLFSKADLTITGSGLLNVYGNYQDGITGKDGLIIDGGTITVTAVDEGIRGKDYLIIKAGIVSVMSGGDGLKSDNTEDTSFGYINVQSGQVTVDCVGDALTAASDVVISGGELSLTSGGGSTKKIEETLSAKAIKADGSVIIDNGLFVIDSADDALHAAGTLTINDGTLNLLSSNDGIHSDTAIVINNGTVDIQKSYEGIEAPVITINGGEINIQANDDGINVSTGTGEGQMMGPGSQMRPGMTTGQESFTYTGSNYLYIHGGTIYLNAGGDGLDSNGAIEMTGGLVIINGPTENMNGALDYASGFKMDGGILVTAGSAGMAQAPGSYSSQNSLLINLETAQAAGTIVNIRTTSGEDVLTFSPSKMYQSILFSSPDLITGQTYQITLGGSSSGLDIHGLYLEGVHSSGILYQETTLSSVTTTIGATGGFMGGPGGMGRRGEMVPGQPFQQQ